MSRSLLCLLATLGAEQASAYLISAHAVAPSPAFHSARTPALGSLQRPLKAAPMMAEEPVVAAPEVPPPVKVVEEPSGHGHSAHAPPWLMRLIELQEAGLGSVVLMVATAVSLGLANFGPTSRAWLGLWAAKLGPAIGGHVLSLRGWINEGLMAVFFFLVGLEIKQELRLGSLATVRKAVLPCIAAVGGMVTPMAVYFAVQGMMVGGSMAALTVPMATDIAFAMAIFGFFRTRMPVASSAFLLTLATVDDLGAIIVLATCFASHVSYPFLAAAGAVTAGLVALGRKQTDDLPLFVAGGGLLWWCLLSAGVNADVAGVIAALCVSTRAETSTPDGGTEPFAESLITWLAPLSTFLIMPLFALANTAVNFGGSGGAAAGMAPAVGIGLGLLLGKPLGIAGFTIAACACGLASLPEGMKKRHVGIVGMLGGIGFTMCLLLCEVSLPGSMQAIPKLSVLISSALASIIAAIAMRMLPVIGPKAAKAA